MVGCFVFVFFTTVNLCLGHFLGVQVPGSPLCVNHFIQQSYFFLIV